MMLERKSNTMNVIEKATATQMKNIEAKTEKSLCGKPHAAKNDRHQDE